MMEGKKFCVEYDGKKKMKRLKTRISESMKKRKNKKKKKKVVESSLDTED